LTGRNLRATSVAEGRRPPRGRVRPLPACL